MSYTANLYDVSGTFVTQLPLTQWCLTIERPGYTSTSKLIYRELATPGLQRPCYDMETSTEDELDTWVVELEAEAQRRRAAR
jgi:hypothetical protein